MELTAGTVVAERFRLVRKLGEGGMGSVWLAHHEKLDTACAVKFINSDVASAAGVKERFEREAKIAAQIKSPHVVHVLDYGVSEGAPYIAMEYLEGEDLAHRLEARGRLTPEETVGIIAQVARALTKAHAAGLVHRDLKPENIYLVRDDEQELVKVLDFGIAKAQSPMPDAKTRTGVMMGTPRFMSPEQAQGLKTLDYRADLWSLAVIAYRCVVGELPFDSEAIGDLVMRIIVHPLPVPSQVLPGLPASFDAWWARGAARAPAERFQSAKELADALAGALGLAAAPSGPSNFVGAQAGPTPASPSSGATPAPRAFTPPQGAPMTATMVGAATMLPGGQPTSLPANLTAIPYGTNIAPAHTMSPASHTFPGALPPPKKSPIALIAVGVIVALGALAGIAVVALKQKGSDAPSAATAAPTVSVAAAAPTAAPSASPDPAPTASSAAAIDPPSPASAAPTTPAAPPPVYHPKTTPTPVPARTGKVRIAAPPG